MNEAQIKICRDNGYIFPREINGVVCAIHYMFATWGLFIGIDEVGYERRYCYEEMKDAVMALLEYKDTDSHPIGPWIKLKGTYRGRPVDDLNPSMETI